MAAASGNILTNTLVMVDSIAATADTFHPPEEPPTLTLLESLSDLPNNQAWAIEHITLVGLAQHIAISVIAGTAIAVSNGLLKDQMGMAAYHVKAASAVASIEGVLHVPGSLANGSSHMSKLGGLYGIITVVEALMATFGITAGAIEVGWDGDATLRVFDLNYYFDPQ
jgi:hypothetical protein